MPSISHHWVRLTDAELAYLIEGPPDQEDDVDDDEYVHQVLAWADRSASIVEDGLETW